MSRRGPPLPQGRPHVVLRRQLPLAVREPRLRRLPDRRARHRLVTGRRARRVPGGGAARPARRLRLARCPGVVRRPDRHVGHVVLRLQLPADRVRATAGAEGDLRDLRHRRSVDRRRALAWRRAAARRSRRLQPLHDADVRAASRAGGLGRRLVRRVGAPAGDQRAVGADLAAREPARRVLEPRIGTARRDDVGLRAHRRARS